MRLPCFSKSRPRVCRVPVVGMTTLSPNQPTIHGRRIPNTPIFQFYHNSTPNILTHTLPVTGPPPYAEDSWKEILINNLKYHVSCRTTRCELPNVDPTTGTADRQEPLRTLKRERGKVDVGASPHPCLGMQMVPLLKGAGGIERIRVGDEIEVVGTGEHCYVRMFQ